MPGYEKRKKCKTYHNTHHPSIYPSIVSRFLPSTGFATQGAPTFLQNLHPLIETQCGIARESFETIKLAEVRLTAASRRVGRLHDA